MVITMLANKLSLHDGLNVREKLGNSQGVVKFIGLSLLQWARLDVIASIRLNTGNGNLQTTDAGGDLNLNLARVLVGDKVGR